jgi:hypothetical protein
MLDLPKIKAREMDSSELTEAVRERTSGVDLDGAIVRLRAYDCEARGGERGSKGALARLQRRCLNFSLEIHPRRAPKNFEQRRRADGDLRTLCEESCLVRRGAAGARGVWREVRPRSSGEGARGISRGRRGRTGERRQ